MERTPTKSSQLEMYRANAYYIPVDSIGKNVKQRILKRFTYKFYEEKICAKCEHLEDRHSDICDACPSYQGTVQTAKVETVKEREYLSVPRGGKDRLLDILDHHGYEDILIRKKAPKPSPFSRPIHLVKELYPYQPPAVRACLKKKLGILKAPPRTGKTVMATAVICQVGQKTLILAHQTEWLSQFRETFLGSDTQQGFTDARPHQVQICKTLQEFKDTDVCLATFATFMSDKGKLLLRAIRNLFPVIFIDECQGVPAKESSRVTAQFNYYILIGLSGTPARKRNAEWQLADDLLGEVIHEVKVDRMRPRVEVLRTITKEFKAGMGQAAISRLQTSLESSTPRRKVIIKDILKRAKQGHMVIVPMTRVESILRWTREINEEMEEPGYAMPFFGGMKKAMRMQVIEGARNYRHRIIVGNIALLSTGLNIPRASCLYEIGVNNNIPKAGQRISRILTPMEGKPQPLLVFTLDNCDLMRKCRQNEFWNCLIKDFNPVIDQEVKSMLMSYFSQKKGGRVDYQDLRDSI